MAQATRNSPLLVEVEAELASDQHEKLLARRLDQLLTLAQRCRAGLVALPAEPAAGRFRAALAGAEAAAAILPVLHTHLRRQHASEKHGDQRCLKL